MLEEKISKNLGVKYVYLPKYKRFICENGVTFTLDEYKKGIDLKAEYEKRAKDGNLFDYPKALSDGTLVKQKKETVPLEHAEVKPVAKPTVSMDINGAVRVICLLLAFTSVISMYISTLHTATYLYDYVDIFSSWLMSASVTAYNSTAFEVSVLFHVRKRNFMASIFMLLWITVTLFSMTTTVSVFYDRFNFTEAQIAEENKEIDSGKLALSILQKKENDLREAIKFKQKDIEYRQEREYATSAVRKELVFLEEELQKNLSEQQEIMSKTPEAVKENVKKKESLFSFIGRLLHMEGGILEFIMSTLSAIFVNLIAPLSLTAVTELLKKKS